MISVSTFCFHESLSSSIIDIGASSFPCSHLSKIVRVKAHILWIWIPFNLTVRIYIFKNKFAFTFVRTWSIISFNILFSLNNFISTIMTELVKTALTHEHSCKITQANWTVVLKLISEFSILRKKITNPNFFQSNRGFNSYIWDFWRSFRDLYDLNLLSFKWFLHPYLY